MGRINHSRGMGSMVQKVLNCRSSSAPTTNPIYYKSRTHTSSHFFGGHIQWLFLAFNKKVVHFSRALEEIWMKIWPSTVIQITCHHILAN